METALVAVGKLKGAEIMSMMSIEKSNDIMMMANTRDAIRTVVDALPEDELLDAFFILMQYARTDRRRQQILADTARHAYK